MLILCEIILSLFECPFWGKLLGCEISFRVGCWLWPIDSVNGQALDWQRCTYVQALGFAFRFANTNARTCNQGKRSLIVGYPDRVGCTFGGWRSQTNARAWRSQTKLLACTYVQQRHLRCVEGVINPTVNNQRFGPLVAVWLHVRADQQPSGYWSARTCNQTATKPITNPSKINNTKPKQLNSIKIIKLKINKIFFFP